LAKIAAVVEQALARRLETGGAGSPEARVLAQGKGWRAADIVCASGPQDRRFEERHSHYTVSIVAAGMFQYRSARGCDLMTPGSLMLGAPGWAFECGHDHGAGDRCISFWFAPEYFEHIAANAGVKADAIAFRRHRLPPLAAVAPIVARACAGVTSVTELAPAAWEELGLQIAGRVLRVLEDRRDEPSASSAAVGRVAAVVGAIDKAPADSFDLRRLAGHAGLSPYHFLRTFQRVTGVTPHQYIMRARLREAARRLATEREPIIHVALDCGFNDVSNFNRAFRREFGLSPRRFRAHPERLPAHCVMGPGH
jgi:AraC-like DNA-binding protein